MKLISYTRVEKLFEGYLSDDVEFNPHSNNRKLIVPILKALVDTLNEVLQEDSCSDWEINRETINVKCKDCGCTVEYRNAYRYVEKNKNVWSVIFEPLCKQCFDVRQNG